MCCVEWRQFITRKFNLQNFKGALIKERSLCWLLITWGEGHETPNVNWKKRGISNHHVRFGCSIWLFGFRLYNCTLQLVYPGHQVKWNIGLYCEGINCMGHYMVFWRKNNLATLSYHNTRHFPKECSEQLLLLYKCKSKSVPLAVPACNILDNENANI